MLTTGQLTFFLHLALGVMMVHGFVSGVSLLRPARGRRTEAIHTAGVVGLALAAWATAITGTWLVYPGYRAEPAGAGTPGGALLDHPKSALLADPGTAVWHEFGMEWKEHVGWLVPILVTVIAYLAVRHRDLLTHDRTTRRLAGGLLVVSAAGTVVAAGLGAVINTVAPNQFLAW